MDAVGIPINGDRLPLCAAAADGGWQPKVDDGGTMQRGINVLALVKETERYIFLYDDESSETLLQKLGEFASSTDLNFSWYDAAVLSQKLRRLRPKAGSDTEPNLEFPEFSR